MMKILYFIFVYLFFNVYNYSQEIVVIIKDSKKNYYFNYLPNKTEKVYYAKAIINNENKSVSLQKECNNILSKDFKFFFNKSFVFKLCFVYYNPTNEGQSYYDLINSIEKIKNQKTEECFFVLLDSEKKLLSKEEIFGIYKSYVTENKSLNNKTVTTNIKNDFSTESSINKETPINDKKKFNNSLGAEMNIYLLFAMIFMFLIVFSLLVVILINLKKIKKSIYKSLNELKNDIKNPELIDKNSDELINEIKKIKEQMDKYRQEIISINENFTQLRKDFINIIKPDFYKNIEFNLELLTNNIKSVDINLLKGELEKFIVELNDRIKNTDKRFVSTKDNNNYAEPGNNELKNILEKLNTIEQLIKKNGVNSNVGL